MKKNIYCIHDDLNDFMSPFLAPSDAFAKRDFASAVNNEKASSAIAFSPDDFALYNMGSFDLESGAFDILPVPVLVCKGGALVAK